MLLIWKINLISATTSACLVLKADFI